MWVIYVGGYVDSSWIRPLGSGTLESKLHRRGASPVKTARKNENSMNFWCQRPSVAFQRSGFTRSLCPLLVVVALAALAACGSPAHAQAAKPDPKATDVVQSYLKIFNAGMLSGD